MLTQNQPENNIPIACDPSAIPASARAEWVQNGKQVYAAVTAIRELPDGYGFRLPADPEMLLKVAAYIANERLCCAFLRFTFELEPGKGPFWLSLSGAAGVKQYLADVFASNELLPEDVAKTAGLR
jgi:hypothetical protein